MMLKVFQMTTFAYYSDFHSLLIYNFIFTLPQVYYTLINQQYFIPLSTWRSEWISLILLIKTNIGRQIIVISISISSIYIIFIFP